MSDYEFSDASDYAESDAEAEQEEYVSDFEDDEIVKHTNEELQAIKKKVERKGVANLLRYNRQMRTRLKLFLDYG
uniref:Uncharacterized protein n=1 Tax=Ditylenchus dipsaci TaxID=166011 RepID=A0A915DWZ6_9BILA